MAGVLDRRGELRTRARLIGLLLLVLPAGGCQWCPTQTGNSAVDGHGNAIGQAQQGDVRSNNAPSPGTKEPAAQALIDAERGQRAMVRCLQSERALTDGNELRCEDWAVVRDEFLRP